MRKYLNARFGPGQACVNRQGQVLIRRDIGNADQAGWDILGDCRDFMREVEVSSSGSTRGHAARRLNTRNNQSSPSKIEPDISVTVRPVARAKPDAEGTCKKAQIAAEGLKARREYEANQRAALDRIGKLKALRLAHKASHQKADT
jgi:hypothetical protein